METAIRIAAAPAPALPPIAGEIIDAEWTEAPRDTGWEVALGGRTVTMTRVETDALLAAHGFTAALRGKTTHRSGRVGTVPAALRVIFAAKVQAKRRALGAIN